MKRLKSVIVVLALIVTLAGCFSPSKNEPAIDISRKELWRTINVNLHEVDPEWVVTDWPDVVVRRSGCGFDSSTWMPEGPPWQYEVSAWARDPSQGYLDTVQRGLDALAQKGFTVAPPPRPDDPRDRNATDSRGFHVDVRFTDESDGGLRVDLWSWSPCVRHPGEVDDW